MQQKLPRSHTGRNFILCSATSFLLFLIGSFQVLNFLLVDKYIPKTTQLTPLSLELVAVATLVISLIAIPLGYVFMFFFGGVVSTRAIRLYLYVMRGKSIVASKAVDLEEVAHGRGNRLTLTRQFVYFGFILAVVVSFAFYLSRHDVFPIVSPPARTSDIISLITRDYIMLTISGSLMVPHSCACTAVFWRTTIENNRRRSLPQ